MNTPVEPVNGWEQLTLDPPFAYEIVLKIGIVREADHVQFQLEVRDPSTKLTLALSSRPHTSLHGAETEVHEWCGDTARRALDLLGPF